MVFSVVIANIIMMSSAAGDLSEESLKLILNFILTCLDSTGIERAIANLNVNDAAQLLMVQALNRRRMERTSNATTHTHTNTNTDTNTNTTRRQDQTPEIITIDDDVDVNLVGGALTNTTSSHTPPVIDIDDDEDVILEDVASDKDKDIPNKNASLFLDNDDSWMQNAVLESEQMDHIQEVIADVHNVQERMEVEEEEEEDEEEEMEEEVEEEEEDENEDDFEEEDDDDEDDNAGDDENVEEEVEDEAQWARIPKNRTKPRKSTFTDRDEINFIVYRVSFCREILKDKCS